jgi:uncharacterized protein YbaR (Trm112 family)/SAM-dependent methyltransferase
MSDQSVKLRKMLDILACPACRATLERQGNELICTAGHRFPIVKGVPILFPDGRGLEIKHEAPLTVRGGYDPWVHRTVMQSLTRGHIVVDIGAGNMMLDDPCIIRTDVTLTPYVDLVADAHALPFKDESVDYVLSLAVLEHLHNPFIAGQEMFRVLRRGGYVYCDTNFVFCYHGYPHHYFNSSLHGIKQVFGLFTELRTGVPPYQMPSYALENYISTYLQHFKPATPQDIEFIKTMQGVLTYPIRKYDAQFPQDVAYRFSAGIFYLGYKRVQSGDSVIPEPILAAYRRDVALQSRFPEPNDLTRLDNLMTWAQRDGRQRDAAIAASLETYTFSKYWDDRPLNRAWMESLPLEEPKPTLESTLTPEASSVSARPQSTRWWALPIIAGRVFVEQGPRVLARRVKEYLRWLALRG